MKGFVTALNNAVTLLDGLCHYLVARLFVLVSKRLIGILKEIPRFVEVHKIKEGTCRIIYKLILPDK